MVIVDSSRLIVGGVDTHRDVNVAAVVDMNGGLLGVESFRTTADGHKMLATWMRWFGTIERVGVAMCAARKRDHRTWENSLGSFRRRIAGTRCCAWRRIP